MINSASHGGVLCLCVAHLWKRSKKLSSVQTKTADNNKAIKIFTNIIDFFGALAAVHDLKNYSC